MNKEKIHYDTPIAYMTFGQFLEAFREAQEEPIKPKKELPRFITVPQLAELAHYSINTINIKNSKGEIPGSKKLNGRVLFDTETILDLIESGAVKTKDERLQTLENNFKNKRKSL